MHQPSHGQRRNKSASNKHVENATIKLDAPWQAHRVTIIAFEQESIVGIQASIRELNANFLWLLSF